MLVLDRPFMSLPDNTRVSMTGKSVTAVYPSEGYLYVEQDNRTYGLRVAGDCAGISVGDRVNVTGTIGTRKPDGVTASERCTSADGYHTYIFRQHRSSPSQSTAAP